jgi:hypothetical protein
LRCGNYGLNKTLQFNRRIRAFSFLGDLMTKKWLMATGGALALSLAAGAASASVIVLDFDALKGVTNEAPLGYYDGGVGSQGTGPGPSYGVTFSSNTITGCSFEVCGTTNASLPPSEPNIIFFLGGSADTMDVSGGFDTGFSFFYSAIGFPGFVNVWSGLDATGSLLATIALPLTPFKGAPGCTAPYCPFVPVGVSFAGVAHSVDFGGTANYIAFDDITLGSSTAGGGGVPEPSEWALMIAGMGLAGAAMRRQRKAAVAA